MADYTQVNFPASFVPNVWERCYPLADGTVATLSYSDFTGEGQGHVFEVITHSENPQEHTDRDWRDSVIRQVSVHTSLAEAEVAVAELLAA
jgi:hypothetical protein